MLLLVGLCGGLHLWFGVVLVVLFFVSSSDVVGARRCPAPLELVTFCFAFCGFFFGLRRMCRVPSGCSSDASTVVFVVWSCCLFFFPLCLMFIVHRLSGSLAVLDPVAYLSPAIMLMLNTGHRSAARCDVTAAPPFPASPYIARDVACCDTHLYACMRLRAGMMRLRFGRFSLVCATDSVLVGLDAPVLHPTAAVAACFIPISSHLRHSS